MKPTMKLAWIDSSTAEKLKGWEYNTPSVGSSYVDDYTLCQWWSDDNGSGEWRVVEVGG